MIRKDLYHSQTVCARPQISRSTLKRWVDADRLVVFVIEGTHRRYYQKSPVEALRKERIAQSLQQATP